MDVFKAIYPKSNTVLDKNIQKPRVFVIFEV
jgi:hypothetical protein